MNIEDKYRIKYLISLFKQLEKQFGGSHDFNDGEVDPTLSEEVDRALEKTYGYKDQEERDYLYAAFIKNYFVTGGDFDQLGESVKPFTPQLKSFEIEETEWCEVKIINYYSVNTYFEGIAKSLLYNGWLDANDYEQEILDCNDREVEVTEVPKKEEKIDEDLEYWKTNTNGPEDGEYKMGV